MVPLGDWIKKLNINYNLLPIKFSIFCFYSNKQFATEYLISKYLYIPLLITICFTSNGERGLQVLALTNICYANIYPSLISSSKYMFCLC